MGASSVLCNAYQSLLGRELYLLTLKICQKAPEFEFLFSSDTPPTESDLGKQVINHNCKCGMVWYGMVWYGMVWYGVVWYGLVSFGKVSGGTCIRRTSIQI